MAEDLANDVVLAGEIDNGATIAVVREIKPKVASIKLLRALNIEREVYCLVTATFGDSACFIVMIHGTNQVKLIKTENGSQENK